MSEKNLRIVYAGTPDFAAESLQALIADHQNIIAAYTQPDRPAGRGRKLAPTPVKSVALEHGIDVFQPVNFKEEGAIEQLTALKPDLMIVAAYGLILPKSVLAIPRLGCINIHGSLLPRWRGAAPIQRAIQAGDTETGITIMQMDVGLDTGDMILKKSLPITSEDTGGTLHDKLSELGAISIIEYLDSLEKDEFQRIKQDESLANYAHKLSKNESNIDWSAEAETISRCVRAFNPWPVSYSSDQGERVRILEAEAVDAPASTTTSTPGTIIARDKHGIVVQCGQGALKILKLQLPGSKALNVADLINGGKPVVQLNSQLGQ